MRPNSPLKEAEVILHPPRYLESHWDQITEGWNAFFDNQDSTANPYPMSDDKYAAWRWGFLEAMDYGQ